MTEIKVMGAYTDMSEIDARIKPAPAVGQVWIGPSGLRCSISKIDAQFVTLSADSMDFVVTQAQLHNNWKFAASGSMTPLPEITRGSTVETAVVPAKTQESESYKKDAGKAPMVLFPSPAMVEVAHVLDFGAKKYSPHGWRTNAGSWSRMLSAVMRHIAEIQEGRLYDEETGRLHAAHAIAGLAFLTTYMLLGLGVNDLWSDKKELK